MRVVLRTLIVFLVATIPSGSATAQIVAGSKDLGAIWFVGDSITQSNADGDSSGSPRSELYSLLTDNDYSFTYTGHFTANPEGLPVSGSTPADNLFQYHSGISASVIGDNFANRVGMTENLPSHWSGGRLASVKPNIILIMLGTNDIGVGIDIANAPDRLSNYIDEIFNLTEVGDPSIFVANIPPSRRSAERISDTANFNAAVPEIVAAQQSLGRDVYFVDQFTPLDDDYANLIRNDNLHTNAAGNESLAQQWFNGIQLVSSVPEPITGDFDADGDVDRDDVDFYIGILDQPATGNFAQLDLDGDGELTIADHDLHVTTLVVTSNGVTGALLGDVNLDGMVDILSDAFALVESLGQSVASRSQGDLNADGMVDVLGDAFILISQLGQSN